MTLRGHSKKREVCKFAGKANLYTQDGKFLINSHKKKDISNIESYYKKKYDVNKSREKFNRRRGKDTLGKFKVQSDFEEAFGGSRKFHDIIQRFIEHQNLPEKLGEFMENLFIMVRMLLNARDLSDVQLAIMIFVKFHTGMSFVKQYGYVFKKFIEMLGFDVQSGTPFDGLKDIFVRYNELKNTKLFEKFFKIITYVLSFTVFKDFAQSRDWDWLSCMHYRARSACSSSSDLLMTILESLVYILRQGFIAIKTGSWDPLIRSSEYEEWFTMAERLKTDSVFLNNPDEFNIDIFSYLSDLRHCIEQGTNIHKHLLAIKAYEAKLVVSILSNLKLIESEFLTKRASMKTRKAPFSLLIFGGSSVAKSTFTQLTYMYYAKLYGLNSADEYKYTRNFADEYWVNFSTMQWCIHLDDVAFIKPSASQGIDPSLMEIIGVVNNVAYVPVQADLADKGRTPVRSRLVLATTNVPDLNTHSYFSCPLAVQRRFPYVVKIEPKPEYSANITMLDGSLVPPINGEEFPDYWIITISKVVPANDKIMNQTAKLIEIAVYNNINDYLLWFKSVSEAHDDIQDKVTNCNYTMETIKLCKCGLPVSQCRCVCLETQSVTEYYNQLKELVLPNYEKCKSAVKSNMFYNYSIERTDEYVRKITHEHYRLKGCFKSSDYVQFSFMLLLCFIYMKLYNNCKLFRRYFGSDRILYNCWLKLGSSVTFKYGFSRTLFRVSEEYTSLPAFMGTLLFGGIALLSIYKLTSNIFGTVKGSKYMQSNEGTIPLPDVEEREPVWYKQDVPITTFDVSPQILSYKGLDRTKLISLMKNSSFHIRCWSSELISRPGRMFCVGSQLYLASSHVIPEKVTFKMKIVDSPTSDGVSNNRMVTISSNDVYRIKDTDICFVRIRYMSPRRDFANLFTTLDFSGKFKARYLARNEDGSLSELIIEDFRKDYLDNYNTWFGKVAEPTVNGHCGSVCLVDTGYGPCIFGMHMLGKDNLVGIQMVTKSHVQLARDHFKDLVIVPSVPKISSESVSNSLVELQSHASIRYVNSGHARCFGSLAGFRPRFKSQVRLTYIAKECMVRGYKLKHAAPRGKWKPWRNTFEDTSHICEDINLNILDSCVESFTNDIKTKLSKKDIEELMVYDDMTAVNGCNGVTYVDKLNRATSAGFPWCKSKKYFLEAVDPVPTVDDPRMPVKEIMDRVDEMIENYKNGIRSSTIYMGSQKDEPLPFQKVADEKDRIFTGSAFDFSIVMRKYFLSITRCIQKNRFVFECAAGTVAQSLEWEEIYEYLTTFGEDRIIEGDFKKFDKKMSAVFILAAFDVLINIMKLNPNISSIDERVMKGISYDVAFPFVNLKGDLYEFDGGNPSGQSLTVIINSIANSLYMRYAYSLKSPRGDAVLFTAHVKLMTYGDDNEMGVSAQCTFFHHTGIAESLALIGVTYTMANKEAESVPFVSIHQASFLKRSWRWDDDIGARVAPLEEASIDKMLLIGVHAKNGPSDEHHSIEVIESALREYFYYGRREFEFRRNLLMEVVDVCNLNNYVTPNTFRSFDSYVDDFWRASKHVVLKRKCPQRALYICPAEASQNVSSSLVTAGVKQLLSFCVQSESGNLKYPIGAFPLKYLDTGKYLRRATCYEANLAHNSY